MGNGWNHGPMMGWDRWDLGLWPGPGMLWVLFLALIIVGLLLLVRDWRRDSARERRYDPAWDAALAELGRQYAIGRIDREEFFRRKSDLA
ncbi:MAG: hypothetical protein IH626_15510 [Rhodospirillales bacterium]|nr:hypothetical protein [Rhodospirillales bacterium]